MALFPCVAPTKWHTHRYPAVLCFRCPWPGDPGSIDVPPGVALSRKGAKSRTGGRKLRSTGTKAGARVSNEPNSLVELKKQLEERTRELAEARGHLSEALEQRNATSEILGAVARSSTDVQIVLDTVCQSTARRPRRPPWPDHANRVCSVCPRVSPGPFISR